MTEDTTDIRWTFDDSMRTSNENRSWDLTCYPPDGRGRRSPVLVVLPRGRQMSAMRNWTKQQIIDVIQAEADAGDDLAQKAIKLIVMYRMTGGIVC